VGVLTVEEGAGTITIAGSNFQPGRVVLLDTMAYRPADGTKGRNFGPGGVIGFTDEQGGFAIPFSRRFIVGSCSTPGSVSISVMLDHAAGSGGISGPGDAVAADIIFKCEGGEEQMGEINLQVGESCSATLTPRSASGDPTTPDDVPVWTSDPGVVDSTVAEDGLSATFTAIALGSSAVTAVFHETHGGVGDPTEIVGTGLINVLAADAVTADIEFAKT